jgi:hydrogenase nickel incorporation protein HypA/HybF
MHELGLCEAIVGTICRSAAGRPVEWARVRVGGHPVDPAVVQQGVAMAAAGTEANGMQLEIVVDPFRTRCGRCGAEEPVTSAVGFAACAHCGGIDVELIGSEAASVEAVRYGERAWTPSSF